MTLCNAWWQRDLRSTHSFRLVDSVDVSVVNVSTVAGCVGYDLMTAVGGGSSASVLKKRPF